MTDMETSPMPEPAPDTARLDRIEARLAMLEDRVAGAGAAMPPPQDPASPPDATAAASPWLAQLNDFVRNNPVLALIIAIIALVLLSHLID
jgi:hypothetical protein